MPNLKRSVPDEAAAVQTQIGFAERRLARLGRDYGCGDLALAARVLNALNHVLDFGGSYTPQLEGAVRDFTRYYEPRNEEQPS